MNLKHTFLLNLNEIILLIFLSIMKVTFLKQFRTTPPMLPHTHSLFVSGTNSSKQMVDLN